MKSKTILIILLVAIINSSCSPVVTTGTTVAISTVTPAPKISVPTPTWAMPDIPQLPTGSKPNFAITVLPQESNDILINPGKGWVLYYPYEDKPKEIWDVISVCYTRLEWGWMEPTEGEFQWAYLDDAIKYCSSHGKKFAFGIMAASSSSESEYVTPEWVFMAGSKSTQYKGSKNNLIKSPVWNDPIYLNKMQNFISALALHFDGNPNIAFIDARNCGNFGEWHSLGCSELSDKNKDLLIDQWKVFKKTTIIVPTNFNSAEFQARYGTDTYGFGIRRDSSEIDQNAAGYAFGKSPAISEWSAGYELLKTCQDLNQVCWSDNLIPEYMSKSKFSYDNLGQWGSDSLLFLSENPTLVREWANKMGYWFKLSEVTYPANLGNGSTETLSFKVRNDGVAPIYVNKNNTFVRLALMNSAGIVLAISDPLPGINPFSWKPGEVTSETITFSFPPTQNASNLAIGLFSSSSIMEPDIKLGNAGVLPNNWFPIHGKQQP
jgi:hypothetical protein